VKPAEFAVTIEVKDTAGNPVEGLRVGLLNDMHFLPGSQGAAKAAVAMQFMVAQEARVRYDIRDIEGNEIAVLVDGTLMAGSHRIMWNGRNSQDEYQPSGRYTAHMVAWQLGTDVLLFEDSTDMLMSLLDTSRVPQGYTDRLGRLILKDRKLFPHLYDRPAMEATDENGQIMGKIVLTPTMMISLGNEAGDQGMRFKEEIIAGTVLKLFWDPALASSAPAAVGGNIPSPSKRSARFPRRCSSWGRFPPTPSTDKAGGQSPVASSRIS
jgi:hypothetical protein